MDQKELREIFREYRGMCIDANWELEPGKLELEMMKDIPDSKLVRVYGKTSGGNESYVVVTNNGKVLDLINTSAVFMSLDAYMKAFFGSVENAYSENVDIETIERALSFRKFKTGAQIKKTADGVEVRRPGFVGWRLESR
ncbi:MAG: hypothetical protein KKG60_02885 [Nanoarchaeota archaeon]|nr:hypothetical protein [Nanoarchaeota archaeon]